MASIQGIYIALFGRPADPDGLAYWEARTNGGQDLSALTAMTGTPEYQSRFAGLTNEQIVTQIYQNMFGRAPDAAGLAFFVDKLAGGTISLDQIAINIFDGAQSSDRAILVNKEQAADLFTEALALDPAKKAAYVGENAIANAHSFLDKVTADPASIPSQTDVNQATDPTQLGQEPGGGDVGGGGGGGGGGGTTAPELFKLTGDAADSSQPGHWHNDRAALASISNKTDPTNSTNSVLEFKLNASHLSGYDGAKYTPDDDGQWDAGHGSHVSYQFYIDSSWATDGVAQRSGVWIQMQNNASSLDQGGRYAVLEYLDKDAVIALKATVGEAIPSSFTEGFRVWNSQDGWDVDGFIPVSSTGWVNVDFNFGATNHSWSINGSTQYNYLDSGEANNFVNDVTQIDTVFVNSYANGQSTSFLYDNLTLTGQATA